MDPGQLLLPDTVESFYPLHQLAWQTRIIYCLESLSLLVQFVYIVQIMKEKVTIIEYLILSFKLMLPTFMASLVILISVIIGMAIC